jgi:hypothetical protein
MPSENRRDATLQARLDQFQDDFLRFESIANPKSMRPDLHAFLLLDQLQPGSRNIVCAARRGELFLGVDLEALARAASDEQLQELVRCGVSYDSSRDCLQMFT